MSKNIFIFPGQGSQFVGMGQKLLSHPQIKNRLEQAKEILGYDIQTIMLQGQEEQLRQTAITQPAIFLHSVLLAEHIGLTSQNCQAVAGHSLGEISALTAAGYLQFEEALQLVKLRAEAMTLAAEQQTGSMAAILGLEEEAITQACSRISTGCVQVANYNTAGQVVISGNKPAVEEAVMLMKTEYGLKKAIFLPVSGAFHSPLMMPAQQIFQKEVQKITFQRGFCPIYQNITAAATTDPFIIRQHLIDQITGAVKWRQTMQAIIDAGFEIVTEVGPKDVLTGLFKKIKPATMTLQTYNDIE